MKPLWSEKRLQRELLLYKIQNRCDTDKEFGREIGSFFGDNLLNKLPISPKWYPWHYRLSDLIELTFRGL